VYIPRAGFPEFTQFFNHGLPWKLQPGVNFPMAIGAQEYTFLQLLPDFVPTASIALTGDTKVFV
jgi:hypothetical protein